MVFENYTETAVSVVSVLPAPLIVFISKINRKGIENKYSFSIVDLLQGNKRFLRTFTYK